MTNKIFILLLIVILFACGEDEKKQANSNYKNLNVTILLDLSDRISISKNPDQAEKDINIISSVVDNFKLFLSKKGVVNSDDKLKIIFYPTINYDIYQSIADSLNIDFSNYNFSDRKKLYNSLSNKFKNNLTRLYSIASKAKLYEGADIFNYFKHRIIDDCILSDSNYINVLVILTDGYIYHKNSKYELNNRFSYIIPESYQIKRFRNNVNWEDDFNKNDFGLLKLDNNLSKLNILVAEVSPLSNSPKDYDIIYKYLSKWFEEQNVAKNNYKIIKSDLTSINKNIVNNFFEKITTR
ncbi:MAG: hypothetical protein AB1695_13435 [Stygiobacter sp.]|jgi:hypothetical protein|uniref:Uncharacterized protein n=1 Tax=Stygiobacter electus TaxID=3032292 RepID=A0AAE3TB84_9BACT|nr:hypothetical protein [Stygiobacter electus]MDF1610545.1 hypothetical protein [Stygiobacter electus]